MKTGIGFEWTEEEASKEDFTFSCICILPIFDLDVKNGRKQIVK
ncbi:MAG: hypothetical protein ACTTKN_02015 [Phocaeicola sp.]